MVNGLTELTGKHLLFTMIVCDRNGEVEEKRQYHGIVENAGGEPVLHRPGSDERIPVPPMYEQVEKADPDQRISLEQSGETVEGIEYTLTCVKSPP
ncbi:MAG: hypothetical protein GWO11_05935 [Desulfuromonadales bacterium]|nr:hypothetical protein [Desulfuromonadales bacterium]NIR33915.1 hypothetical protein [Desulfuromonadales bacterium]NIS43913.1 hypothetical protein [Desulfuromonadales bacterium]